MSEKNPKIYLQHILDCLDAIENYTRGIKSKDEFFASKMIQDAVIRNLEIIGEAAKQIPENVRQQHPKIEWKKMAGLRDILIHNYLGVDLSEVWVIIAERLPQLKAELQEIAKRL